MQVINDLSPVAPNAIYTPEDLEAFERICYFLDREVVFRTWDDALRFSYSYPEYFCVTYASEYQESPMTLCA